MGHYAVPLGTIRLGPDLKRCQLNCTYDGGTRLGTGVRVSQRPAACWPERPLHGDRVNGATRPRSRKHHGAGLAMASSYGPEMRRFATERHRRAECSSSGFLEQVDFCTIGNGRLRAEAGDADGGGALAKHDGFRKRQSLCEADGEAAHTSVEIG